MNILIQNRSVLPSAVLAVEGKSVEIVSITGTGFFRRNIYTLFNFIFSHINGYKKRPIEAKNSFYIPIENISSVSKRRLHKPFILWAVCFLTLSGITSIGISGGSALLTFIFFLIGLFVATSIYVLVRHKWAFSVEVNSGNEYLLISKKLDFLETTYDSIKSIVDNPEQTVYNNYSFDFVSGDVVVGDKNGQ